MGKQWGHGRVKGSDADRLRRRVPTDRLQRKAWRHREAYNAARREARERAAHPLLEVRSRDRLVQDETGSLVWVDSPAVPDPLADGFLSLVRSLRAFLAAAGAELRELLLAHQRRARDAGDWIARQTSATATCLPPPRRQLVSLAAAPNAPNLVGSHG